MEQTKSVKGALRKMRRSEYLLSPEDTERCLREETWGVLSVHGDGGFPYGVPMNYVWDAGTVLLHCTSKNSHRLDALRENGKVCFTVVPEHTLDRDNWSTRYTSVIIFGTAEILTGREEKLAAMRTFMERLAPQKQEEAFRACDPGADSLVMVRVHPVLVTGRRNS